MPHYRNFTDHHSEISLWRIEEGLSFFEHRLERHDSMQNESKRLQWYATRLLVSEKLGDKAEVMKDENGKPYLKNSAHHISISHTAKFASVMFNKANPVGIDLEMINPKVEKIAHKFLRPDEIEAIEPAEKTGKLILYWSAKEALYKLYGKRNIEFKTQLLIAPFQLEVKGILNAEILTGERIFKDLAVHYEFFEDHVLSYVSLD